MKEKIRTTSFWVGISGIVMVVVNCMSSVFGIVVASDVVEAIIVSISSILVIFGVVNKKDINDNTEYSKEELLDELRKDDEEIDDL